MSRFYGTISSDCTKDSTKRGHNYVSAHVRGWNIGIHSEVDKCKSCGADRIRAWESMGSYSGGSPKLVYERCSADCQK